MIRIISTVRIIILFGEKGKKLLAIESNFSSARRKNSFLLLLLLLFLHPTTVATFHSRTRVSRMCLPSASHVLNHECVMESEENVHLNGAGCSISRIISKFSSRPFSPDGCRK